MEEVYRRVEELLRDGRIEAVGDYLNEVLDQCRKTDDYDRYLSVGNELMTFYVQTKNYEQAHVISEDLLLLLEELQHENSEYSAKILMNSASVYAQEGHPELACSYYQRAIRILRTLTGVSPVLAECAAVYAMHRMQLGQSAEAEALFAEAMEIFPELEQNSPEVLDGTALSMLYVASCAGLGESAMQRGDLAKAADYYKNGAVIAYEKCSSKETAKMLLSNAKQLLASACISTEDASIRALEQMFES